MVRTAVLVLLIIVAAPPGFTQSGSLDPAFTKVPFDQWLQGGDEGQIGGRRMSSTPSSPCIND